MSLNGIDISNWQSGINLSSLKTDFIIVKSSEGINWTDPSFSKLYRAAKLTGKRLGVYHFARPTANNDPVVEADSFLNIISKEDVVGRALLVLDWEAENKHNTSWAKKWLDRVYTKTGIKPLIYMSESVANAYDWSAVANSGYELWVARYRDYTPDYDFDMSNAGAKPSVKYWKTYKMWQWTSSGRLVGYSGNLDCNLFYGTGEDWDKLVGKTSKIEGWKKESGYWYYYKNGVKVYGWQQLKWSKGTNWFYFNETGKMVLGWQQLKWSKGTDWFYFDNNGAMVTGWQCLPWKNVYGWYFFNKATGAMMKNTTLKGTLTVDADGAVKTIS